MQELVHIWEILALFEEQKENLFVTKTSSQQTETEEITVSHLNTNMSVHIIHIFHYAVEFS